MSHVCFCGCAILLFDFPAFLDGDVRDFSEQSFRTLSKLLALCDLWIHSHSNVCCIKVKFCILGRKNSLDLEIRCSEVWPHNNGVSQNITTISCCCRIEDKRQIQQQWAATLKLWGNEHSRLNSEPSTHKPRPLAYQMGHFRAVLSLRRVFCLCHVTVSLQDNPTNCVVIFY